MILAIPGSAPQHGPIAARDKLNRVYFLIFNWWTNVAIIGTSVVLLIAGIVNPLVCATHWYHMAEGVVTLLFALEVAMRLVVQKGSFWGSTYNVVEAAACCFCLLVFSIISTVPRATRAEHQLLIVLRFIAQGLRVVGVLKHNSCLLGSDGPRSPTIDVHLGGGVVTAAHGRGGSGSVGGRAVDSHDLHGFPV